MAKGPFKYKTPTKELIDQLGQCIFRVETNEQTMHDTATPETAEACHKSIRQDIEELKIIKTELMNRYG